MNKDFESWGREKKILDSISDETFFVNPRDIYFTKMGVNIGFEENGKKDFLRPVLVLKKLGNLFFTVALTSKGKNTLFYHKFQTAEFNEENKKYCESSYCILSQVKVMDKKRFTEKMGFVSQEEFFEIQKKLKNFLF